MVKQTDLMGTADRTYDLVIIGSGFGALFYLHEILERNPPPRILVLEWGQHHPHDWQIAENRNSAIEHKRTFATASEKVWNFTIGLGGGTNCWFAQTPRFHPSDFRLRSLYGVGADWPIDYDELEPHYGAAEAIMAVSGDPRMAAVLPRSTAFPQPPHRMSAPDRLMAQMQPERHFAMPTARARVATGQRSACCASFRCSLCPVDAKFTMNNGLLHLFDHPSVELAVGAKVTRLDTRGDVVVGAMAEIGGREVRVAGDRSVLGANAIHSPAILQRSGMADPLTGAGLHESYGCSVEVLLDGLDNFDGSTITTGLNYSLYDGDHRRDAGAALVYFDNRWTHGLRAERGRWRQSLPLMIVVEEAVEDANRVSVDSAGEVVVSFAGTSDYARRGQQRALDKLPEVLAPLPVEDIVFKWQRPTESHLQGTLRMGDDPATSVIDRNLVHHRWRNLTVVGTATFPTCGIANPSLTAAALSLRAASLA
jgi:choline dehydrogenase-like flavoprotein